MTSNNRKIIAITRNNFFSWRPRCHELNLTLVYADRSYSVMTIMCPHPPSLSLFHSLSYAWKLQSVVIGWHDFLAKQYYIFRSSKMMQTVVHEVCVCFSRGIDFCAIWNLSLERLVEFTLAHMPFLESRIMSMTKTMALTILMIVIMMINLFHKSNRPHFLWVYQRNKPT